jgi:class 3 adenylate cyclase
LALTRCAEVGARVVKFIGDAVLFVSPEAHIVLEAAQAVVEGAGDDGVLPEARAGLDYGEVLPLEGDYFGNPVNVAARIVGVAMPSTVVVSKTFGQALGPAAEDFTPLGMRELKGVGERELLLATAHVQG